MFTYTTDELDKLSEKKEWMDQSPEHLKLKEMEKMNKLVKKLIKDKYHQEI